MKLPIKKKYFDKIKSGEKIIEFRDAHITFICEETGETLQKTILTSNIIHYCELPKKLLKSGLFTDKRIITFLLGD